MAIRPEEITSILENELRSFERTVDVEHIGTVLQVGDGIARVYGLPDCRMGEMLEFPGGVTGLALNLEEDSIGAVLIGDDTKIKEGDTVRETGRIIEVPVGKAMLGRVINALGQPIDEAGPIPATESRRMEVKAPGVVERQPVTEPLQTGIKAIDAMIPIGRGQRELVIGDRQTGKTSICIDTILNQKYTHEAGQSPVYCIYVAIGQKMAQVARVVETLKQYDALKYTVVVVAGASDSNAMQYLAPFAGVAIGEWFRDNGMHALIVYDDLSKHAAAYRTVSLLLRRPPGREAFPGDVFYLHSRLLERAAKRAEEFVVVREGEEPSRERADQIFLGDIQKEHAKKVAEERGEGWTVKKLADSGGSLTALPIIETQQGDVSAYIPTNVISITDGQIYLEPDLFFAGVRPAINVGISVSRVGGNAQIRAMRTVAGKLKLEMSQYRDVQAFAQFASDLDKATQQQLLRGQRLTELLKQDLANPYDVVDQVIAVFSGTNGFLDEIPSESIADYEKKMLAYVHEKYPDIVEEIKTSLKASDEVQAKLRGALTEFNKQFLAK